MQKERLVDVDLRLPTQEHERVLTEVGNEPLDAVLSAVIDGGSMCRPAFLALSCLRYLAFILAFRLVQKQLYWVKLMAITASVALVAVAIGGDVGTLGARYKISE